MQLLILLTGILLMLLPQDHHREIVIADEMVLDAEKTVIIDNIFGQIEIKKGPDKNLSYRVLKRIDAEFTSALEKGIKEVQLKVLRRNDSIIFFIDAPFICSKWKGCYNNCNNWGKLDYDFKFDYTVELPSYLNLDVNTINEGDVTIDGVEGELQAGNVNGHVTIREARSVTKANTVNGDVTVGYIEAPSAPAKFHTINGTISVYCPENLNAVVTAKSMHGDLFTDFEYEPLQPKLIRQSTKNENGTTYKLEETFGIEIGQNGPTLSFETLNGNIYLKEIVK